jgi:hypothetical protein
MRTYYKLIVTEKGIKRGCSKLGIFFVENDKKYMIYNDGWLHSILFGDRQLRTWEIGKEHTLEEMSDDDELLQEYFIANL